MSELPKPITKPVVKEAAGYAKISQKVPESQKGPPDS
jgi:hypothetical protein